MDVRSTSSAGLDLNALADSALEEFAAFGRYLETEQGSRVEDLAEPSGVPAGFAKTLEEAAERSDALPEPSLIGKALSFVGKAAEAFSGIGEMAKTFANERDAGSKRYPLTALKSVEVTARISAGAVVGGTVAAGLSAAGLGIAAPLLLGGALAYGTARLVKSGFDML